MDSCATSGIVVAFGAERKQSMCSGPTGKVAVAVRFQNSEMARLPIAIYRPSGTE